MSLRETWGFEGVKGVGVGVGEEAAREEAPEERHDGIGRRFRGVEGAE